MPKRSDLSRIAAERGMTEEELLATTLQATGGKIDKAAALLKMYPYSIRTELSRRGLEIVRDVTVRLVKVKSE